MTVEIIQGDCREVVPRLGVRPNFILADPPFNLGKAYGPNVDDSLTPERYAEWLFGLYRICWAQAAEDAVLYAFSSPGQRCLAEEVIQSAGWQYCQRLVWYRPNGMQRSRSEKRIWACLSEEIHYARKGAGLRSALRMPWYHDVITIPTPQSNHRAGRWHVCQKPVLLYRHLLQAHEGIGAVLDPTVGSGSSMVACVELGLDGVGVEIDPTSAELARERVRAAESGQSYRDRRARTVPLFG